MKLCDECKVLYVDLCLVPRRLCVLDFGREISRSAQHLWSATPYGRERNDLQPRLLMVLCIANKWKKNSRLYRNRNLFTLGVGLSFWWNFFLHTWEIIGDKSSQHHDQWRVSQGRAKREVKRLDFSCWSFSFTSSFELFCKSLLISTNSQTRSAAFVESHYRACTAVITQHHLLTGIFFVFVGFKLPLPNDRERMHQQHN